MIKLSNINPFMEKLSDYNANRAYEVATLGSLGGIIGGVGLGHLLDKRKAKADLRKFEDAGYPELKANYTTPKRYKVLGGLAGSRLGGALALALYNGMPSKQASIKLADVPFYANNFNMGLLGAGLGATGSGLHQYLKERKEPVEKGQSQIGSKALGGAGMGFLLGHRAGDVGEGVHRSQQMKALGLESAAPKWMGIGAGVGALAGAAGTALVNKYRQHRYDQGFGTEEQAKPEGYLKSTLMGALGGASAGNSLSGMLRDDPAIHADSVRRQKEQQAEEDAFYEEQKKKKWQEYDEKEKQWASDDAAHQESKRKKEEAYQNYWKSKDDNYKKQYAKQRYGEGYDHEGFRVMPDEFMNLYNPKQHGDSKYVSKIWESLRRSGLANTPDRVKSVENFMKAYGTEGADPNVLKGYVDALGGGTSNEGTLLRMLWEKKYGNPGSTSQKVSFYKVAELFGALCAEADLEKIAMPASTLMKALALPTMGALIGGGLGAYSGHQEAKRKNQRIDNRVRKGKLTEEEAQPKRTYPWDQAISRGFGGAALGAGTGAYGTLLALDAEHGHRMPFSNH